MSKHNPVLDLPAVAELRRRPVADRAALRALFLDLADDCRARADQAWKRHKAPMACYWKACGVYSRHIARSLA